MQALLISTNQWRMAIHLDRLVHGYHVIAVPEDSLCDLSSIIVFGFNRRALFTVAKVFLQR